MIADTMTNSKGSGGTPHSPPAGKGEAGDFYHQPVLLEAVLGLLPESPELIVDATLGGGGHSAAMLEKRPGARLFGCDQDPAAVAAAAERLASFAGNTLLKNIAFSHLSGYLEGMSVDFLLADLGVSSPQLDRAERGFSFLRDGPLDMRMNPASEITAEKLVNSGKPERLKSILTQFGEERFTPRIVRAICEARQKAPITTTGQLAAIVAGAVPAKFHRKGHHPATRTFQALRMEVNQELEELRTLLDIALPLLKPGGVVAIISFHSLEDRLVKNTFRDWESPCDCPPRHPVCTCGKLPLGERLTRRPLVAGEEAGQNPRSRSAKLRAFRKSVEGRP